MPDEREVAFGRVEAREGVWALLSERRLLWGGRAPRRRIGSLELRAITSYQEIEDLHRWSVRLHHAPMTQRVHVPEHRVLWWAWGNAEAPRTFTETVFSFSRRETALARALREKLTASGMVQLPTIHIPRPPRSVRMEGALLVYRPVQRTRLNRLLRCARRATEDLYSGAHLFWGWRLLGWALFGIPLVLVNPWLSLVGVVAFEVLVIGLLRWSHQRDRAREAGRTADRSS